MVSLSNKVQERFISGIKKFQPILTSAKSKDINESDTVVIITDILSEVFGYDKYTEITTEHIIKKTFCDLAIKINGKVKILIEAKAIGLDLKNEHTKQAIDYGVNLGVDWIVLTNGYIWHIYKILFSKPIDKELIYEFNFLNINHRNQEHLENLYHISKEGISKSSLDDYYAQRQALSRFFIGQMMLSEPIITSIKKELKKISPGVKIENDEIKNVLVNEVLKREVLEGDKSEVARRKINKILNPPAKKSIVVNTPTTDSPIEEINKDNITASDIGVIER